MFPFSSAISFNSSLFKFFIANSTFSFEHLHLSWITISSYTVTPTSLNNLKRISLDVKDEELISRIKKRSLVSGRVDDQSEEKINNRISVYKKETLPVLNHYKKQNKYYPIDGHGTIDNIFDSICSKIDHWWVILILLIT